MNVKTILAAKGGNVVTIEPTADLAAAVKLLTERHIGSVVSLAPITASSVSCRSAILCGRWPSMGRQCLANRSVRL